MRILSGIGASPRIAIGKAVVMKKTERSDLSHSVREAEVEVEIGRFRAAVTKSVEELWSLKLQASQVAGDKKAEIFEAHASIVQDSSFLSKVETRTRKLAR